MGDALRQKIDYHPAHDKGHVLTLVVPTEMQKEVPCDGCKKTIEGPSRRYKCDNKNCSIKLIHACCAVDKPDTVKPDDDNYRGVPFQFLHEHKAGADDRCGICQGKMRSARLVYRSGAGVVLHPCCALQTKDQQSKEEEQSKRKSKKKCKCHNSNPVERNITIGRSRDNY